LIHRGREGGREGGESSRHLSIQRVYVCGSKPLRENSRVDFDKARAPTLVAMQGYVTRPGKAQRARAASEGSRRACWLLMVELNGNVQPRRQSSIVYYREARREAKLQRFSWGLRFSSGGGRWDVPV
jgi:hypothetical protein